jgi:hypothetical protein
MNVKKSIIISCIFSFAYVGFATFSVLNMYPKDIFYNYLPNSISLLIEFVTLPAYIISFGYRFCESEIIYPVFIIQILMFILVRYLTFLIIKKISKKT